MDQLLEVTCVREEPTDSRSSDQLEVPTEMNVNIVKQENDCLVQSAIYIKTEPQEDEIEVPVVTNTSYEICSYDYIKFTTIKMQDPLDVGDELKVPGEEHFPVYLDGESRITTESTKEEKNENFVEFNEHFDSHGSTLNIQNQMLSRSDSNLKVKQYICNECGKIFKQKSHLDNHRRIHTGEKPFSCEVCEKSFSEKGTLKKHMLIHSDTKPYVCDVCKKVFRDKSNLNAHKLLHNRLKPFSCDECNKLFRTKRDFVRHNRIHARDKPFICDVCKKAFTVKSQLTAHRRTHLGIKPFLCDVCNKSFALTSQVKKHKKTHKN